jgi:hypothetical protein
MQRAIDVLHAIHSGHVGDYVVYLVGGMVVVGGLAGLALT